MNAMIDTTKDNWRSAMQRDYTLGRLPANYPVPAIMYEAVIHAEGVYMWYKTLHEYIYVREWN
jgi:hypothetical protein